MATILFTGHNLHFIEELIHRFSRDGHVVLRDEWKSHVIHDEDTSHSLLEQADIIICEWALGNSVWYSNRKKPNQRLYIRFHRQEIETEYPHKIMWGTVDRMIFVSPILQQKAIEKFSIPPGKTTFIPNFVNTSEFSLSKSSNSEHTIGLLGSVPRLKRLDRALDILKIVRLKDSRFNLRIKGKLPGDYPWMLKREKEMNWYQNQFDRIESDPILKGHVYFDEWGQDVPQWFTQINYILSVSDYEGSHQAVAEGAASGAVPMILKWDGADQIYPSGWCFDDLESVAQAILDQSIASHNGRKWSRIIQKRYDIKRIYKRWNKLLRIKQSLFNRFLFSLSPSSRSSAKIQVEEE